VGESLVYSLPSVFDINSLDTFTFTFAFTTTSGTGSLADIAEVQEDSDTGESTLNLAPLSSSQAGVYEVTVTVTDSDSANSGILQSFSDTFVVAILDLQVSDSSLGETGEATSEEVPIAAFLKIGQQGEVQLTFDHSMRMAAGFQLMDSKDLELSVLS